MLNIYEIYDKSVELMSKGENLEAAIFHAMQFDFAYEHDAQKMLLHWHAHRLPRFDHRGGYPRLPG